MRAPNLLTHLFGKNWLFHDDVIGDVGSTVGIKLNFYNPYEIEILTSSIY